MPHLLITQDQQNVNKEAENRCVHYARQWTDLQSCKEGRWMVTALTAWTSKLGSKVAQVCKACNLRTLRVTVLELLQSGAL
ncbi:hypothetical protein VTK73DRAFT_8962 [Phialemonium thermophilum]|uniref:Uncharacterized protein n=1 Tax=Phialemonium thermophilum TaxID=223376 RepID=A0ABR3Y612_9PEZI